jgi:hypothetical protein
VDPDKDPDPVRIQVNYSQLEAAAMDKVCLAPSNNIVESRAVDPDPDPIRMQVNASQASAEGGSHGQGGLFGPEIVL